MRFEIEADIPEGWEPTGDVEPTTPVHLGWQDKDHAVMAARIILRRTLPPTVTVELPRSVAEIYASTYATEVNRTCVEAACRAALAAEGGAS